jgi:hypothetical protein
MVCSPNPIFNFKKGQRNILSAVAERLPNVSDFLRYKRNVSEFFGRLSKGLYLKILK